MHILNCMFIGLFILIIYFIVYILDLEDLPRDGCWCTVLSFDYGKNKHFKTMLLVDVAVINV